MSVSNESILSANRAQTISEVDDFTEDRYRQMFGHFPSGTRRVLDVGCNTGRGGAILKSLDPQLQITGLDCIPERIEKLDRSIYERAHCCYGDDIPEENGAIDAIVGGEMIEHVPPTKVDATLMEFFRILRLKGRLILTTPNPYYLKNKIKSLSVLLEPSHVSQHYPECLIWRMKTAGFSSVRVFGSGRVSKRLGERFPLLSVYGSYLIQGDKW